MSQPSQAALVPNPNPLDGSAPLVVRHGKRRRRRQRRKGVLRRLFEAGEQMEAEEEESGWTETPDEVSIPADAGDAADAPVPFDLQLHSASDVSARAASQLLRHLARFQSRLYREQPRKFNAHKRYVTGFRETLRAVRSGRCRQLVLLASDTDAPAIAASLEAFRCTCAERGVRVLQPLRRRQLGAALRAVRGTVASRRRGENCVGILSTDGAYAWYCQLLEAAADDGRPGDSAAETS
ncbi:hypothetical protein CDCA_CDCA12G3404 [Cyanidium caldarium]|uniref:Ribosomal protein eL8/eL30/eS12/Gadd45 domain-containing protein n=1 Tax=Cyanidium caldarium TaxID=2771 RepID=A0AAV9IZ81_CYACA|nr:hypothetical protein CDCA_CDCA12G3404 [Cyanidium caldarium]